ncbi:MAG: hypothetical protein IT445_11795 [Phycisphaeraceae bacterium]|nr:hypothetical protein [Phycisphaeraceae bacterium]
MSQIDPQLVQRIADEVMRAMTGLTESGSVKPGSPESRMGMCQAAPSSCSTSSGLAESGSDGRRAKPNLSGFVTANQLEDALNAAKGGSVTLAADAKLTPLAQDLVRKFAKRVRREGVSEDSTDIGQIVGGLPWMWWTCGSCQAVQRVVEERRSRLLPCIAPRQGRMIARAVRDIDAAVAEGRAAGGLMFVTKAARAMCLANRRRALRAILGHCDDAVSEGIAEVGANLLVLEFPFNDYAQMARRVDLMLAIAPGVPAEMRSLLATTEGVV